MLPSARLVVTVGAVLLVALGVAWESWLAPVRPGAWLLSLKMLPLALSLRGLARGDRRVYQWWSMGILAYFAEGVVRASSDVGLGVILACAEIALAVVVYGAILAHVRGTRAAR